MTSHRYLIPLYIEPRILVITVYADRSVEAGVLVDGAYVQRNPFKPYTRQTAAESLRFAHSEGYSITRENI